MVSKRTVDVFVAVRFGQLLALNNILSENVCYVFQKVRLLLEVGTVLSGEVRAHFSAKSYDDESKKELEHNCLTIPLNTGASPVIKVSDIQENE